MKKWENYANKELEGRSPQLVVYVRLAHVCVWPALVFRGKYLFWARWFAPLIQVGFEGLCESSKAMQLCFGTLCARRELISNWFFNCGHFSNRFSSEKNTMIILRYNDIFHKRFKLDSRVPFRLDWLIVPTSAIVSATCRCIWKKSSHSFRKKSSRPIKCCKDPAFSFFSKLKMN